MKYLINNALLVISILCVSSCTYVYYPNYPVIAEVEEGAYGAQLTIGGTKAQVSGWYSFDSSIYATLTLSGAQSWLEETSLDATNTTRPYKTFTASVGVGYQFKFGTKGIAQLLGGAGISSGHLKTSLFNPEDAGNVLEAVELNYQSARFYLQPSIGAQNSNSGFYFIPRFTVESFTSLRQTSGQIGNDLEKRSFMFIEPMFLRRYLSDVINIDLYLGASFTLGKDKISGEDDIIATQPITLGIGLSRNF